MGAKDAWLQFTLRTRDSTASIPESNLSTSAPEKMFRHEQFLEISEGSIGLGGPGK